MTTAVRNGTFTFPGVPAGAARTLTVIVYVAYGVDPGTTLAPLVTVTSRVDSSVADTVKPKVRVV